MRDHELDRILSEDEDFVPSPDFVRNVMDAVKREALEPPPIPFPWARALPGLILCVLLLGAMCITGFTRPGPQPVQSASGPSIVTTIWSALDGLIHSANVSWFGWILLALLLTYASVKLSMRLYERRA